MKLTSIEVLLSASLITSHVSAWAPSRLGLARRSTRRAAALALQSDHGGSRSSIDVDVSGDGSKILTFETGVIGKQAAGAAMVSCGGTVVYTTACFSPKSTTKSQCKTSSTRPTVLNTTRMLIQVKILTSFH